MAGITEEKVYQAFGLEAPAEEPGAQAQEPAEPAVQDGTDPTAQGAQVQEIAEPAASGADEIDNNPAGEEPAGNEPGNDGEGQPMSMEQRKQFAARRRQQEQQAAIDAALQEEKKRSEGVLKDLFERVGLKNTFTGEPITTMEQFNEWDQKFKAEKLQQELAAGKLTQEGLNAAISEHPMVKQAAEIVRQHGVQEAQHQQEAFQAKVDDQIAQIGKLDPSIKSVNDLLNMPTSKEFYAYVHQGHDFLSAFKLANFDRLTAANAEAERQRAMNNARGKEHMTPVGNNRGSGALSVPAKELAYYRAFNPNATEADIQVHFNKYKKQGG